MIELLSDFPENVVAVACRGHVTKKDYETVLIPRVEAALADHEKLRLYYEIGSDFSGIEPGAVWEDFKIGMEHLSRWERIAIVTDVEWIQLTMRAFRFLFPGELRIASNTETADARSWIAEA